MAKRQARPVTLTVTDRELLACILKVIVIMDMAAPLLKQLKSMVGKIITADPNDAK